MYSATVQVELRRCVTNTSVACSVRVTVGSAVLPQSFQKVLNCTGDVACSLVLASPPWEKWLRVTVESLSGPSTSVSFEVTASFTGVFAMDWGAGWWGEERSCLAMPRDASATSLCWAHHG